MGRGTARRGDVSMAVSWFRVTRDLELPDVQVTLGNLFPSYFAIQELQVVVVRAQNVGLVANLTVWYGPLN